MSSLVPSDISLCIVFTQGQLYNKQSYGEEREELIKTWDGVVEGPSDEAHWEEYKEDVYDDGECDIINDIERIQQALLGLSSIETEAEFRQVFADL